MHLLDVLQLVTLWRKDWKSQDLGQGTGQKMVIVVYGDPNQKIAVGKRKNGQSRTIKETELSGPGLAVDSLYHACPE